MTDGGVADRWVTRSRLLDIGLFGFILLLILLLSPRLRVYYRVTVVDVTVEEIQPSGTRRALPTPAELIRPGAGYWDGDSLVDRLAPRISEYMKRSEWPSRVPPGTRYEWRVRWSENSTKLDQAELIVWEAPPR
jgi:hypothetical protein